MRLLLILASATVILAGCNGNDQAQENEAVEESLTANSIVANDITAIDAVTADAANMAADVDINFTNDQVLYNGGGVVPGAAAEPSAATPSKARSEPPRRRAPAPAREAPESNNAGE